MCRLPIRERAGCIPRASERASARQRDAAATCTRARACETRENTIKAAPGKNTNLNGTKEICSHIRCIRMNGARLLQFTIYCFATFFSADASGIRSLLPVPPPRSPSLFHSVSFSFLLSSQRIRDRRDKEGKEGKRKREREREKGRTREDEDGRAGRSGR